MGARFVVVNGPPASGKSTLAGPLAAALGLPLIAKDTIKDALLTTLGADDVAASNRLGAAAIETMFAVAAASPVGAVLDANLRRSFAAPEIERLPGPVVEVFCRCDPAVAADRYRRRAGTRHAGHFDEARGHDPSVWSREAADPVAGGWPLLELDTTGPASVDLDVVVAFVRAATG